MTQTIANYEILGTLGRNTSGGRITYLAQKGDRKVVIKQFQFATLGSDWSGWKALKREVDILKSLDHPKIPRYIESFEQEQGFCLVQEYIPAESLGVPKPRSLEQIQDIGRQVLKILVYLQSLHPVVLHRDIKPENVLCNDQSEVFLVDFGFSRLGAEDIGASSMMVGTIGFIPPELFGGREPSKASDLYSLGATLLCLLTGTPTHKMSDLIDDFAFSERAFEGLEKQYATWLKKMVAVRVSDRFADAAAALEGLRKSESVQVEEGHQAIVFERSRGNQISQQTEYRSGQENLTAFQYRKKIALLDVKIRRANLRHQQNPTDIVAEKTYYDAIEEKRKLMSGESEIEKSSVGFVLKPWHLYAGYTVSVLAATGGLYFFFRTALTSIPGLSTNSPVAECCTSNPCTSLQKWGCDNGIPYP